MTPQTCSKMKQTPYILRRSSHVSGLAPGKSFGLGLGKLTHMDGLSSALSAANTLAIDKIGVLVLKGGSRWQATTEVYFSFQPNLYINMNAFNLIISARK